MSEVKNLGNRRQRSCDVARKIGFKCFGLRCWSHWIFWASFLLHAKYKLSFPVETALVRQRVVFFFFVRRAKRARDGNEKRETDSLCTDPPSPQEKKRRNRVFLREEGVCTQAKRLLAVYAVIGKKKKKKTSQWFSEWILKCSCTFLFLLLVNWVGSVHVFWKTVLNSLIVLSLKITCHLELPTFRISLVFHHSHSKKSKK